MAGYGDDNGFKEWLDESGYDLDANPTPAAVLRQRGSVYVDGTYGPRAPGVPTGGFAQERAWPRTGAVINGEAVPSDVIPRAWVEASYYAAYQEALKPGSLTVMSTPNRTVKRVKTGSTDIEFADAEGAGAATPTLSAIEGLLASILPPVETGTPLRIWSIG